MHLCRTSARYNNSSGAYGTTSGTPKAPQRATRCEERFASRHARTHARTHSLTHAKSRNEGRNECSHSRRYGRQYLVIRVEKITEIENTKLRSYFDNIGIPNSHNSAIVLPRISSKLVFGSCVWYFIIDGC